MSSLDDHFPKSATRCWLSTNHIAGWLVGWLVGRSVGRLVGWLVGCFFPYWPERFLGGEVGWGDSRSLLG